MTRTKRERQSPTDAKQSTDPAQQRQLQPAAGAKPDSGQPGGGQGREDAVGVIREDIHVDPDLTEGHPGYDESGKSGIPSQRSPK